MDYYALADEKIALELGLRLQRLRERRGYSKQTLADAIGEPAELISALEKGKGTLSVLLAVLRQLRAFDQLERFLMESRIRALELGDPRLPSENTVMFRRRKADLSNLRLVSDARPAQACSKPDPEPAAAANIATQRNERSRN